MSNSLVYVPGAGMAVPAPGVNSIENTVTLAQSNAGKTILLPPKAGFRYKVIDFRAIPNGNFGGLTSMELESTAGTPKAIASLAQAQMTDNAVLQPAATGVTLGAYFGVELPEGEGLAITNTGTATTATDILWRVMVQVTGPKLVNEEAIGDGQQ